MGLRAPCPALQCDPAMLGWSMMEDSLMQGAQAAPSILISSTLQSDWVMTLGYMELMMGQRAPK